MGLKRILIIDDEKAFTEMVKLNLESTGLYEVMIENQSVQALPTALNCLPDLILLDVIMPDYEGPDVLNEIREHPVLQHIPIIFLTATVTPDEAKNQDGGIGGHIFLPKPTSLKDLMTCIDRELAKSSNKSGELP